MSIKLGSRVRDMITGFEGIAIGRHEWLHGCNRISVQPTDLKDGTTIKPENFDEQQIQVLEVLPIPNSPNHSATTGGPQNDPEYSEGR